MPKFTFDPRGENEARLKKVERGLERAWLDSILELNRRLSVRDVKRFLIAQGHLPLEVTREDFELRKEEPEEKFFLAISLAMQGYTRRVFQYYDDSVMDALDFLRAAHELKRTEFLLDFEQVNEWTIRANRQNDMDLIVKEFMDFFRDEKNVERMLRTIHRRVSSTGTGGIDTRFTNEWLGQNPNEVARRFKQYIGLTQNQWEWMNNARLELQDAVRDGNLDLFAKARRRELMRGNARRMIDALEAYSYYGQRNAVTGAGADEYIERIMRKYFSSWQRYRARTIARTEGLRAVHMGAADAREAAIQSGVFRRDEITETWNTSLDARVRDAHWSMHGQVKGSVRTGKYYDAMNGEELEFPCDPAAAPQTTINCRCASVMTVQYDIAQATQYNPAVNVF